MDNREQKISDNIGLVHACAKRFKSRGIEYDDLFQAGCLGLVKAVDGFDDDRGVKFSTYAVPVILGEMKRLFRDGGAVKVGRALKELSLKATKATADFTAKEGRVPTVQELAEILEVEPAAAAQAVGAAQRPISLTGDDEEGGGQIDVAVEAEDDIALLAESRECTRNGAAFQKEGFYQYSAAWDSKHRVALESGKTARLLFTMQEMQEGGDAV